MGPISGGPSRPAAGRPDHPDRRLAAVIASIVVVGMIVVSVASVGVAHRTRAQRAALLDERAAQAAALVERRFAEAVQTLTTVRGLFRVKPEPTDVDFAAFLDATAPTSARTDARAPGSASGAGPTIHFVRHVRPAHAARVAARLRRGGGGQAADRIPRDRDSYVVTLQSGGDTGLLGTDVRPIATRRAALDLARDTAEPVVSEWVVPVTARGVDPSAADQVAAVYVPVYRGGEVPTRLSERRAALLGWAGMAIPSSALFADLSGGRARHDVALYDGPPTPRHLVRSTAPAVRTTGDTGIRTLALGPNAWTLVAAAPDDGGVGPGAATAATFVGGALLVALTALLVAVVGRERRRVERQVGAVTSELRESEQSVRGMADAVPVGIFDADLETGRTYYNQTFRDLVEPAWTLWSDADQDDLCRRIIAGVDAGRIFADRFAGTDRDGRTRWFEIRATGVHGTTGAVARLLGSVADVTEDVTLEERLGDARDSALANARMKSEFLANMSHEIRTPLNGVLGLASLMLDDELAPSQRERLVTLRDAGQHLLVLLNDILDFSKMEAGRLRLEQVPFSVATVVEQVTTLHASTAHDKGIELRHRVDPAIGPVTGDPARLRQVLQNLVGNAVKFTDAGHVEVVAELRDRDGDASANQRTIDIAVRDTGIGISDDVQRSIFTAFTQADTSTTRLYGGSGLGLAICRQIIGLMGGELTVDSTEGRGSSFSFTVTLGVADGVVGPDVAAIAPIGDVDARPGREWSDAAVLLVEDNAVNQQVAVGMLAKLGYTADVASDGLEALDALRGTRYDLVLMDCQMPRLDGFETTAHVRAMEGDDRHTPIIAMTAAAMRGDKERCIAAGMDDYVSKPVTVEELSDAIRRTLGGRCTADPIVAAPASDADDVPPLDLSVVSALEELADDEGTLFDRSRATFERTSAIDAQAVHDAAAAGDRGELARVVHKLRGGAATLGATTFVDVCGALEAAAEDASDDAVAALVADFDRELARLRGALADHGAPSSGVATAHADAT